MRVANHAKRTTLPGGRLFSSAPAGWCLRCRAVHCGALDPDERLPNASIRTSRGPRDKKPGKEFWGEGMDQGF